MIQNNSFYHLIILILLLILLVSASGCNTLTLRTQTGLIVKNRTSYTVIIEELKKIKFTDYTSTPWEREYTYYIDESCPTSIRPGEKITLNIEDGYYGTSICDVNICIYRNFHFKRVMLLIIEDLDNKGRTSLRFIK